MQGPYATNEKLKNATKLFEGQIRGSGVPSGLDPLHTGMACAWDPVMPLNPCDRASRSVNSAC